MQRLSLIIAIMALTVALASLAWQAWPTNPLPPTKAEKQRDFRFRSSLEDRVECLLSNARRAEMIKPLPSKFRDCE